MNTPLLKYVNDPDKDEVFHTSAFARAQNGGHLGAASSETFTARRSLDQNRQFVRNYGDSKLATAGNPGLHAKAYDPTAQPRFASDARVAANQRFAASRPAAQSPASQMSRPPLPKNPGINPGIHR